MRYTNVLYATAEDREHGPAHKLGDEFSTVSERLSDISKVMCGDEASYYSEIDYTILKIFGVKCSASLLGLPFQTIIYFSSNFPNMWFVVDDFSCNDYCDSCDGKTESTIHVTIVNNLSEFKSVMEEKIIAHNTDDITGLKNDDDIVKCKNTALCKLRDMNFAEIFSDGRLTKAAR
jgi:hypothetical protein